MRKITAGLFVSLDGVAESPGDWRLPFDAETGDVMSRGLAKTDAILLGRRTYLEFAAYWPNAGRDVPMARWMNETPKYVASRTGPELSWANSTLIADDLGRRLEELKGQPGRNIQVPGSPRLVSALLAGGLLDELQLMIQPVVAGTGRKLFEDFGRRKGLTLNEHRALRNGVVVLDYRVTDD
jgi:dihydrofolate reductase